MSATINTTLCKNVNRFHLNLLFFGRASVNAEWAGEVRSPVFSRLYYILDGVSGIRTKEREIMLEAGKWYLLPAGYSFDYQCEREMDHIFFHIKLCDADGIDLLRNCREALCFDFGDEKIDFLLQCTQSNNILEGLRLRQIVYEILLSMLERAHISVRNRDLSPCTLRALNYIRQNLSVRLTLPEIAQNIFVSKSTLTKHFKKELSMSVNEYIFDMIMAEAEQMVIKNDRSILSISEKYGFSDQFYFSKRFKSKFGKAPREYRKSVMI